MQNSTMERPAAIPQATGYFAQDSTLHLHAPDFTKIADADFKPAYEQAMTIHDAEVQAIANNRAKPTFENTIVALEQSGQMLGRVGSVFSALTGANTNDTLDAIDAEMSPKLAAHYDAINLNPKLFARVKAVYDKRASLNLDTEDAKLLENTYKGMVHAGAELTPAQQEQVKAINARLSSTTTDFGQRLTQATKDAALVIASDAKLAGLSDADIEAAKKAAKDRGMASGGVIALQNTTQQPALATLKDRATREALFDASWNRAERGLSIDSKKSDLHRRITWPL